MEKSNGTGKDYIIDQLKKQIENFEAKVQTEKIGTVLEVGDGVAKISGLADIMASEMVEFLPAETFVKESTYGVALNLEEGQIGVMILGSFENIKEGDTVRATGKILSVPVGEKLIGRVINPLGEALDGKGKISAQGGSASGGENEIKFYPVEKIAPGVIARKSVNMPVQTGIKAIDAIIPIGRGQRELIIADRQTGKTAIAIDAIINQKGQNMKCIYVAIGQKESKVAGIVAKLEQAGALAYTAVVLAGASDPASLLYVAPYAGCAMAEYFLDKGEDVLIVYDDLSKHAVAYREISLLLRRPPGREAYPGDVFYLHSRLLERACKLSPERGGGSITALPIIETQSGDMSAYIPTNVISITDGQIYLMPELFYQGIRPAVDAGLSVSRVGSNAQIKAMKKVAGKMKLEAAQFRELAAFAQFGSELDEDTKAKLERGKRLQEIFKQDQYAPVSVVNQVLVFFALINGLIDDVPVNKVSDFESGLCKYAAVSGSGILKEIAEKKDLSDKLETEIKNLINDYKSGLNYLIKR